MGQSSSSGVVGLFYKLNDNLVPAPLGMIARGSLPANAKSVADSGACPPGYTEYELYNRDGSKVNDRFFRAEGNVENNIVPATRKMLAGYWEASCQDQIGRALSGKGISQQSIDAFRKILFATLTDSVMTRGYDAGMSADALSSAVSSAAAGCGISPDAVSAVSGIITSCSANVKSKFGGFSNMRSGTYARVGGASEPYPGMVALGNQSMKVMATSIVERINKQSLDVMIPKIIAAFKGIGNGILAKDVSESDPPRTQLLKMSAALQATDIKNPALAIASLAREINKAFGANVVPATPPELAIHAISSFVADCAKEATEKIVPILADMYSPIRNGKTIVAVLMQVVKEYETRIKSDGKVMGPAETDFVAKIRTVCGLLKQVVDEMERDMQVVIGDDLPVLMKQFNVQNARDKNFKNTVMAIMNGALMTEANIVLIADKLHALGLKLETVLSAKTESDLQAALMEALAKVPSSEDPAFAQMDADIKYIMTKAGSLREAAKQPDTLEYMRKVDSEFSGAGAERTGGARLNPAVERAKLQRNRLIVITNAYGKLLQTSLRNMWRAIDAMSNAIGTPDMPIADTLYQFKSLLLQIMDIKLEKKYVHRALLGLDRDAEAESLRSTVLSTLKRTSEFIEFMLKDDYKDKGRTYLTAIKSAIDAFLNEVDTSTESVGDAINTITGSGKDRLGGDTEIQSIRELVLRDRIKLNESIRNMEYRIRTTQMRANLDRMRSEFSKDVKSYDDKVLGPAVAQRIDQLNKARAEAMRIFANEPAPANAQASDQFDKFVFSNEEINGALNGIDTAFDMLTSDKSKSKAQTAFIDMYYKWLIGFWDSAQAIELYLKYFTEKLISNPGEVSDIAMMIREVDIISKSYDESVGNEFAAIYESNFVGTIDSCALKRNPGGAAAYDYSGKPVVGDASVHYYRWVPAANVAAHGALPFTMIAKGRLEKLLDTTRATLMKYAGLKNLVSFFVHFGSKIGGPELRKLMIKTPGEVYDGLIRYMTISSFAVGLNNYTAIPGTANRDTQKIARMRYDSEDGLFRVYSGRSDVGLDNATPSANPLAHNSTASADFPPALIDAEYIGCGLARHMSRSIFMRPYQQTFTLHSGDLTSTRNTTIEAASHNPFAGGLDLFTENAVFSAIIKSFAAKIFVLSGMYDLLERPTERIASRSSVRMILGGAISGTMSQMPKINDHAVELYIRLPLLALYYKKHFVDPESAADRRVDGYLKNQGTAAGDQYRMVLLPELTGSVFSRFITQIFRRMPHIDAQYFTENEMRELISEINNIYEKLASKYPQETTRSILQEFVSVMSNMMYLISDADSGELRKQWGRFLPGEHSSRKDDDFGGMQDTDYDIFGDEDDIDRIRPAMPSDRALAYTTPSGLPAAQQSSSEIPPVLPEHWKIVRKLRHLLEKDLGRTEFSLRDNIMTTKAKLGQTSDDGERFRLACSLVRGVGITSSVERMRLFVFTEIVGTSLAMLNAIYTVIKRFQIVALVTNPKEMLKIHQATWFDPNVAAALTAANAADVVNTGTPAHTQNEFNDEEVIGYLAQTVARALHLSSDPVQSAVPQGENLAQIRDILRIVLGAQNNAADNETHVMVNAATPDVAIRARVSNGVNLNQPNASIHYLDGNCTITKNPNDVEARKLLASMVHYPSALMVLLESLATLSSSTNDLVQVQLSDGQMMIDFGKLLEYASGFMSTIDQFINVMRPHLDVTTINKYTAKKTVGSLYWLREQFEERFRVGRATEQSAFSEYTTLTHTIHMVRNGYKTLLEPVQNRTTAAAVNAAAAPINYAPAMARLVAFNDATINGRSTADLYRNAAPIADQFDSALITTVGKDKMIDTRYLCSLAITGDDKVYQNLDGSIMFAFNKLLAMFLRQFYDGATGKIFGGLLESFANGTYNAAIMNEKNRYLDILPHYYVDNIGTRDVVSIAPWSSAPANSRTTGDMFFNYMRALANTEAIQRDIFGLNGPEVMQTMANSSIQLNGTNFHKHVIGILLAWFAQFSTNNIAAVAYNANPDDLNHMNGIGTTTFDPAIAAPTNAVSVLPDDATLYGYLDSGLVAVGHMKTLLDLDLTLGHATIDAFLNYTFTDAVDHNSTTMANLFASTATVMTGGSLAAEAAAVPAGNPKDILPVVSDPTVAQLLYYCLGDSNFDLTTAANKARMAKVFGILSRAHAASQAPVLIDVSAIDDTNRAGTPAAAAAAPALNALGGFATLYNTMANNDERRSLEYFIMMKVRARYAGVALPALHPTVANTRANIANLVAAAAQAVYSAERNAMLGQFSAVVAQLTSNNIIATLNPAAAGPAVGHDIQAVAANRYLAVIKRIFTSGCGHPALIPAQTCNSLESFMVASFMRMAIGWRGMHTGSATVAHGPTVANHAAFQADLVAAQTAMQNWVATIKNGSTHLLRDKRLFGIQINHAYQGINQVKQKLGVDIDNATMATNFDLGNAAWNQAAIVPNIGANPANKVVRFVRDAIQRSKQHLHAATPKRTAAIPQIGRAFALLGRGLIDSGIVASLNEDIASQAQTILAENPWINFIAGGTADSAIIARSTQLSAFMMASDPAVGASTIGSLASYSSQSLALLASLLSSRYDSTTRVNAAIMLAGLYATEPADRVAASATFNDYCPWLSVNGINGVTLLDDLRAVVDAPANSAIGSSIIAAGTSAIYSPEIVEAFMNLSIGVGSGQEAQAQHAIRQLFPNINLSADSIYSIIITRVQKKIADILKSAGVSGSLTVDANQMNDYFRIIASMLNGGMNFNAPENDSTWNAINQASYEYAVIMGAAAVPAWTTLYLNGQPNYTTKEEVLASLSGAANANQYRTDINTQAADLAAQQNAVPATFRRYGARYIDGAGLGNTANAVFVPNTRSTSVQGAKAINFGAIANVGPSPIARLGTNKHAILNSAAMPKVLRVVHDLFLKIASLVRIEFAYTHPTLNVAEYQTYLGELLNAHAGTVQTDQVGILGNLIYDNGLPGIASSVSVSAAARPPDNINASILQSMIENGIAGSRYAVHPSGRGLGDIISARLSIGGTERAAIMTATTSSARAAIWRPLLQAVAPDSVGEYVNTKKHSVIASPPIKHLITTKEYRGAYMTDKQTLMNTQGAMIIYPGDFQGENILSRELIKYHQIVHGQQWIQTRDTPSTFPKRTRFANTDNDHREVPDENHTLFASLAYIIKNIMTSTDSSAATPSHIIQSAADIPIYLREKYRAYLPFFRTAFVELSNKCEFYKRVIESARGSFTTFATEASYANIGYSMQNVPTVHTRLTGLLKSIASGADALVADCDRTIRDIGDEAHYFEVNHDSIAGYKAQHGRDPIMPISALLRVIKPIEPGTGLMNAELLPMHSYGDASFKYQYAIRGLYANNSSKGKTASIGALAKMSALESMIGLFNRSSHGNIRITPESARDVAEYLSVGFNFLNDTQRTKKLISCVATDQLVSVGLPNAVPAFHRYARVNDRITREEYASAGPNRQGMLTQFDVSRLPLSASIVRFAIDAAYNGQTNRSLITLSNAGRASDPKVLPMPFGLTAESMADIINIVENRSIDESIKIVNERTGATTINTTDADTVITANLVDMNIIPFDIHVLSRQMPLHFIWNYAATFDRMIVEMFDSPQVANAGRRNDWYTTDRAPITPREALIKFLLEPYATFSHAEKMLLVRALTGFVDIPEFARPKFISDQLLGKVLTGNLFRDVRSAMIQQPGTDFVNNGENKVVMSEDDYAIRVDRNNAVPPGEILSDASRDDAGVLPITNPVQLAPATPANGVHINANVFDARMDTLLTRNLMLVSLTLMIIQMRLLGDLTYNNSQVAHGTSTLDPSLRNFYGVQTQSQFVSKLEGEDLSTKSKRYI